MTVVVAINDFYIKKGTELLKENNVVLQEKRDIALLITSRHYIFQHFNIVWKMLYSHKLWWLINDKCFFLLFICLFAPLFLFLYLFVFSLVFFRRFGCKIDPPSESVTLPTHPVSIRPLGYFSEITRLEVCRVLCGDGSSGEIIIIDTQSHTTFSAFILRFIMT